MLYLVTGKEEFLREEFLSQLKTLMRRLPLGEHNIDEVGPAASIPDLIAACDTTPFLCDKRMVIARGMVSRTNQARAGRRGRALAGPSDESGGQGSALVDYVARLPETTHLVLVEDDARTLQPFSAARPDAVRRDFPPLRYDAVPRWIVEHARSRGVRISQRAAAQLADLAGPDLRALDSELAKLAAYAGPDAPIEVEHVRELVQGGGPGIFTFLDALAERRPAAALGAAHGLLSRGSDPSELFNQVAALVRRLLVVKELVAQRRPVTSEAPAFGLTPSPYVLDKLKRQAAQITMPDLEGAYGLLHEVDMAIKTGKLDPEVAVELVVAHLVGLAPPLPLGEGWGEGDGYPLSLWARVGVRAADTPLPLGEGWGEGVIH